MPRAKERFVRRMAGGSSIGRERYVQNGMCLQPAPCFSEREKATTLRLLEKQEGTSDEFQREEDNAQREGDPRHDLCQPHQSLLPRSPTLCARGEPEAV